MDEFCNHHLDECEAAWSAYVKRHRGPNLLLGGQAARDFYAQEFKIPSVEEFQRDMPQRWVELYLAALRLKKALASDSLAKIAFATYELGSAAESLSYPDNKTIVDMASDSIKWQEYTRKNVVHVRNEERRICKIVLQDFAEKRWACDHNEEINLKKMCKYAWDSAIESPEMRKSLPNDENGLRAWLKPVAEKCAKYALKPGRRRK